MRFPRRIFLSRLAVCCGAGAIFPMMSRRGETSVPHRGGLPAPGDGRSAVRGPLDRTSAEVFERQVGTTFVVRLGSRSAPGRIRLAAVGRSQTVSQPGRGGPGPTPAFSLIFQAQSGPALPQETYRVEHPQLGDFPLFLVPIGPDRPDARYQAVFA